MLISTRHYRYCCKASRGWPLYEWRPKREETRQEYPQFSEPMWRGETNLRGKRLLIHVEQGLGEWSSFVAISRFYYEGIEVILQVQASLLPLISSLDEMLLVAKDDPLPDFDAYCPLMSCRMHWVLRLRLFRRVILVIRMSREGC